MDCTNNDTEEITDPDAPPRKVARTATSTSSDHESTRHRNPFDPADNPAYKVLFEMLLGEGTHSADQPPAAHVTPRDGMMPSPHVNVFRQAYKIMLTCRAGRDIVLGGGEVGTAIRVGWVVCKAPTDDRVMHGVMGMLRRWRTAFFKTYKDLWGKHNDRNFLFQLGGGGGGMTDPAAATELQGTMVTTDWAPLADTLSSLDLSTTYSDNSPLNFGGGPARFCNRGGQTTRRTLHSILALRNLRSLNLDMALCRANSPEIDAAIEGIGTLKKLQMLNLTGAQPTKEALQRTLAPLTDLRVLDLTHVCTPNGTTIPWPTDANTQNLNATIFSLTRLRVLNLKFTGVRNLLLLNNSGAQAVLPDLEVLMLEGWGMIQDDGIKRLAAMPMHLRTLTLKDVGELGGEAVSSLGQSASLKHLTCLTLRTRLGGDADGIATIVKSATKLEHLDLQEMCPSDDALNAIVKLTRLKVLRIGGENTDLDAGMLIEIAQSMKFLTELHMDRLSVTGGHNAYMEVAKALSRNPSLTSLSATYSGLEDDTKCWRKIAKNPRMRNMSGFGCVEFHPIRCYDSKQFKYYILRGISPRWRDPRLVKSKQRMVDKMLKAQVSYKLDFEKLPSPFPDDPPRPAFIRDDEDEYVEEAEKPKPPPPAFGPDPTCKPQFRTLTKWDPEAKVYVPTKRLFVKYLKTEKKIYYYFESDHRWHKEYHKDYGKYSTPCKYGK